MDRKHEKYERLLASLMFVRGGLKLGYGLGLFANYVSAISPKRNAWSVIATLDGAKDRDAGIEKVRQGLEKYLQNIEYDKITKTERGAHLITGNGNGRKTNVPVVFAVGVFEAAPGQLAGTAFVVDSNAEDYYKEAVRYMCQTIRGEKDFAEQEHEVAKPVTGKR